MGWFQIIVISTLMAIIVAGLVWYVIRFHKSLNS